VCMRGDSTLTAGWSPWFYLELVLQNSRKDEYLVTQGWGLCFRKVVQSGFSMSAIANSNDCRAASRTLEEGRMMAAHGAQIVVPFVYWLLTCIRGTVHYLRLS
jgi:hypothetical protein